MAAGETEAAAASAASAAVAAAILAVGDRDPSPSAAAIRDAIVSCSNGSSGRWESWKGQLK